MPHTNLKAKQHSSKEEGKIFVFIFFTKYLLILCLSLRSFFFTKYLLILCLSKPLLITHFPSYRCWVFNGTQLIRGPVSIFDHFKDLDRSLAKIDAAFVWGANGRTYLFSGQHYWKYNEAWGRVDLGYPAKITGSWGGVPEHLDSAMTWINGRTYFFKDNGFWLFDNLDIQTAHTEPMMISSHWMKCRAGYDTTSTSSSASTSTEGGDSSASLTTKNISILFISIIFSILNYVV
jgi:hypothetical protein